MIEDRIVRARDHCVRLLLFCIFHFEKRTRFLDFIMNFIMSAWLIDTELFLNGFTRVSISHALDTRPTWSALSFVMKSRKSVLLLKWKMQNSNNRMQWSRARTILSSMIYCVFVPTLPRLTMWKRKSTEKRTQPSFSSTATFWQHS